MLIRRSILERIRRGEVTLAFRRWRRPSVRPGTHLRTAVGVVAVDAVTRVEARDLDDGAAQKAGFRDRKELLESLRAEGGLYRIDLSFFGDDPRAQLRDQALSSTGEREDVLAKLSALDRRAQGGPFVQRFLRLIAQHPGRVAALLASEVSMETLAFKARVRKLKELGLTESLEVGYRLSPRGREVLDLLAAREKSGAAGPSSS